MSQINQEGGELNNRDYAKVEAPEFDGKAQGDAFLEWLITVEHIFKFKDYSEEKKVKLVEIKLKG